MGLGLRPAQSGLFSNLLNVPGLQDAKLAELYVDHTYVYACTLESLFSHISKGRQ